MFVRRKRNRSGSISIQIVDKSSGKYILYETIGYSKDPDEIEFLYHKAQLKLKTMGSQTLIPFNREEELQFVDTFVTSLESMSLVGPELLLGKIFDQIGFNAIDDELFRDLVITRIVYPVSKLKTTHLIFSLIVKCSTFVFV